MVVIVDTVVSTLAVLEIDVEDGVVTDSGVTVVWIGRNCGLRVMSQFLPHIPGVVSD